MTRLFHRAGILLAWLYSRLGMSPNAITWFSGVISTAGALLLVFSDHLSVGLCTASFVIQVLAYASDCSDGQLARATGRTSTFGAWLDHVMDAWKMLVLHFSLGWVVLRVAEGHDIGEHWAYLALVLGLGGSALYFFGWNYKVLLVGKQRIGNGIASERRRNLMLLPLQFTDFGIFLLLFLLIPHQSLIVWAYLGYSALCALIFAAYLAVSMARFPADASRGD